MARIWYLPSRYLRIFFRNRHHRERVPHAPRPLPARAPGHLPTPLEFLPRLSAELGGPEIWIKRDDCTGLSTGGNKTRKLEYLMAEARAQGADIVITQGATQSNHARQTAAACAKLGVACRILLEDRTGYTDEAYRMSGNVLMDKLHGAAVANPPRRRHHARRFSRTPRGQRP